MLALMSEPDLADAQREQLIARLSPISKMWTRIL